MRKSQSQGDGQAQLLSQFEAMCSELCAWRKLHADASLDEIAAQVAPRRRRLMGELIAQLACQEGNGVAVAGVLCPRCGQRMIYKGASACTKEHIEGEITLKRAYYTCPACQDGFFPPRRPTAVERA